MRSCYLRHLRCLNLDKFTKNGTGYCLDTGRILILIEAHEQCDQMARMFAQYLAMHNNVNWPNAFDTEFSKVGSLSLPITNYNTNYTNY